MSAFVGGGSNALGLGCFFFLVFLFGLWIIALLEVFKDIKRRAPDNVPIWVLIVLFFGPLGVAAWLSARPDLPIPPSD